MLAKRIIPCLDVKGGRVVKGVNFVNLRDAGDPVEQAALYDALGADELVFLDIEATPAGRATVVNLVAQVAEQVRMPLTVGGGVRSLEDMRRLLLAGADKISLNSAAVRQPHLLSEGAARFGSQCMVLAIDARRVPGSTPPRWDRRGNILTFLLSPCDDEIETVKTRGNGSFLYDKNIEFGFPVRFEINLTHYECQSRYGHSRGLINNRGGCHHQKRRGICCHI